MSTRTQAFNGVLEGFLIGDVTFIIEAKGPFAAAFTTVENKKKILINTKKDENKKEIENDLKELIIDPSTSNN